MMQNIFDIAKKIQKELDESDAILHNLQMKNEFIGDDKFSIENFITDKELLKKIKKLYNDGHHARAVEEAYKYLDNLVYKKSKLTNGQFGDSLMRTVFSPNNPIVKLNEGLTLSEKNEQKGYMDIMAGCMSGIRNPRAHDSDWEDSETKAFQLLVFANHLVIKVKSARNTDEL